MATVVPYAASAELTSAGVFNG